MVIRGAKTIAEYVIRRWMEMQGVDIRKIFNASIVSDSAVFMTMAGVVGAVCGVIQGECFCVSVVLFLAAFVGCTYLSIRNADEESRPKHHHPLCKKQLKGVSIERPVFMEYTVIQDDLVKAYVLREDLRIWIGGVMNAEPDHKRIYLPEWFHRFPLVVRGGSVLQAHCGLR